MYRLLPFMWHGMTPEEKIRMVALIKSHGGEVAVDLCKALCSEFSIILKDQNTMFVAFELAKTNLERMLLGAPKKSTRMSWSEDSMAQVERSQPAIKYATCGFLTY